MSTSKYAIKVCLLAVITLNNHANATWQIEAQEQINRDNDRFSILNRELANEKNLLLKNKDKLNKAISAKSSEQIKESETSIKRTEGNIDALNKELGINNRISANTNQNIKFVQIFNIPTFGKNKPLPELVKTQDIDIQPTITSLDNSRLSNKSKLIKKPKLAKNNYELSLYDAPLKSNIALSTEKY